MVVRGGKLADHVHGSGQVAAAAASRLTDYSRGSISSTKGEREGENFRVNHSYEYTLYPGL